MSKFLLREGQLLRTTSFWWRGGGEAKEKKREKQLAGGGWDNSWLSQLSKGVMR